MQSFVDFISSSTVGFLLKLFTGLAAAGFGILGVGAETRDKEGRLTRKGRIALSGILVAGVFAICTSISDWESSKQKEIAAQESNRKLVLAVEKGRYPFNNITGDVRISLSGDILGLQPYKDMLRRTLPVVPNNECISTKAYSCAGEDDGVSMYSIPKGSPLHPRAASPFGVILDNLLIDVDLASLSAGPADKNYRNLGGFSISIHYCPVRC